MTAVSLQTLHALGWTLLHFVWQGAALAALLAAALMVSRNANVRYALGLATLVLMMAAPAITFVWLNRAPGTVASVDMALNHAPTPVATVHMRLNHATSAVPVDRTLNGARTRVARLEMALGRATPSAIDAESPVTATFPEVMSTPTAELVNRLVHAFATTTNREDWMLWLVQAWFVGVMLLSVRTAGGLVWLARTRRGEIEPLSEEMVRQCLIVQQRMGLQRSIRYAQSGALDSPVVLGWFRPIVIVTTQALTGLHPQQLQAIIAHELAHIRRYDAFVNLFQVVAEMLLFYHPAVWWVSRRIRIEREVCCDHEALAACGEPVSYARALTMMEEWRAAPSMSMAANRGPLTERVLRLLGVQGTSSRSRVAGVGACVLGVAVALFAGTVFVAAAQATADEPSLPVMAQAITDEPSLPMMAQASADDQTPPAAQPAPAPQPEPAIQPEPAPQPEPAVQPEPNIVASPSPEPAPAPKSAPRARPAEPAKPAAPPRPAREARSAIEAEAPKNSSYIAGIEAAGLRDVSIEQWIALKTQGITPEYIEGMLATKLHPEVDDLIAMKVNGITPEYIEQTRRLVSDMDIDRIVAMKVQGITPAYIESVLAAKLHPGVDDLIAMKVNGITPEYIEQIRRLVTNVSIDHIIAMKVNGITPEYIRDMQAAGIDIRIADDFIAAKVQGITPEFVKRAIEHGFHDLSIEKLMMLQNIDVI